LLGKEKPPEAQRPWRLDRENEKGIKKERAVMG
jgi:hypothetical protein